MQKKLVYLFISIFVIFASCTHPGEEKAAEVVVRFVEAFYSQDEESVQQTAPFFAELEEGKKEELYKSFREYNTWELKTVEVNGRKAVAVVEFSKPDGNKVQMQFPLEARDGSWRIQEMVSFSTTIDFIPAE